MSQALILVAVLLSTIGFGFGKAWAIDVARSRKPMQMKVTVIEDAAGGPWAQISCDHPLTSKEYEALQRAAEGVADTVLVAAKKWYLGEGEPLPGPEGRR